MQSYFICTKNPFVESNLKYIFVMIVYGEEGSNNYRFSAAIVITLYGGIL